MKYDFDKIIKRNKTGSVKWDLADDIFGGKDLLPMWVADMDFEAPRPVIDALSKRSEQGVYGYNACMPSYYDATINWIHKRHGWKIEKEWIIFTPGIVPAINMLVQTFTEPGDSVLLQKPVYYPFMRSVKKNERVILNNPLVLDNSTYYMDFADLEKKAKDPRAKLLILCSPHNPVGRVWIEDELTQLGNICVENDVLVISDEIHFDLTLNGNRHIPFASLSNDFLMNSITCTAPSKTFNLAGLHTSNIIIANPDFRKKFNDTLERNGIHSPNVFGSVAIEAAYQHGEEWLAQVLIYIEENLEFLKDFIKEKLPQIKVIEPEATYLVWLDFRELDMDKKALKQFMLHKAKVAFDDGYIFGSPEGDGFERINIACPRATLKEGLERGEKAMRELGNE